MVSPRSVVPTMADDDRSPRLRQFFARYVAAQGRARDPRIAEAFAAVPRDIFAGPGPWSIKVPSQDGYLITPDDDPAYLYQNTLVAIDAARGINIGEPSLHACCLDAVSPRPGETVLQIGAGSGYYTAILAQLVGDGGRVHALEIALDLARRAAANLAEVPQATVECRSGLDPVLPRADIVYVSAGLPQIPAVWLDALKPGGRLIFPFQASGGFGAMLRIERPAAGGGPAAGTAIRVSTTGEVGPGAEIGVVGIGRSWPARFITQATFIGCQGGQDDEAGRHLAAAMKSRRIDFVRSLRRDGTPDDTCWLRGDGWWLSTAEPEDA